MTTHRVDIELDDLTAEHHVLEQITQVVKSNKDTNKSITERTKRFSTEYEEYKSQMEKVLVTRLNDINDRIDVEAIRTEKFTQKMATQSARIDEITNVYHQLKKMMKKGKAVAAQHDFVIDKIKANQKKADFLRVQVLEMKSNINSERRLVPKESFHAASGQPLETAVCSLLAKIRNGLTQMREQIHSSFFSEVYMTEVVAQTHAVTEQLLKEFPAYPLEVYLIDSCPTNATTSMHSVAESH